MEAPSPGTPEPPSGSMAAGAEHAAPGGRAATRAAGCAEASSAKAAQSRFGLPAMWMVAFGAILAVCAGAVDTVSLRSLRAYTSHVSGTIAQLGLQLEGMAEGRNPSRDVLHSVLLVLAFVFGAFVCGLVIPKNQVHFGGKSFYGLALLFNSGLLVTAVVLTPLQPVWGEAETVLAGCLVAMACGLQNAMCTMHFGAIVRTTHVTGTATDIGSTTGRAAMILCRGRCARRRLRPLELGELEDDARKLRVLVPIFCGFFLGSFLGAWLHTEMGLYALLVPAAVTGTTGSLYMLLRTKLKAQIKRLERRRLMMEVSEMEVALERAHSFLSDDGRTPERVPEDEWVDLDDRIGHALDVMHDVEASLAELRDTSAGR